MDDLKIVGCRRNEGYFFGGLPSENQKTTCRAQKEDGIALYNAPKSPLVCVLRGFIGLGNVVVCGVVVVGGVAFCSYGKITL